MSIFLRLQEYLHGVMFLTTNRVETFDAAFASRVHLALRYEKLPAHARRSIFTLFINKAKALEDKNHEIKDDEDREISAEDIDTLVNRNQNLTGRQIKNMRCIAQALARHAKRLLRMAHVLAAMKMTEAFDKEKEEGGGEHKNIFAWWIKVRNGNAELGRDDE
jgi:hypothetical protein